MTTKSKIQLRGHCQCCGNEQAVRRNRGIAQHGYTVENGFFQGPCTGHRFHPIEESHARADEVVASVRASVAELRLKAEKTLAGLADPEQYKSGYHYVQEPKWERVEEFSPFADASESKKADIRDGISRNLLGKAQAGEQFADFLAQLVENVHGKPLIVVAKSEPAAAICEGEKRISVKGSVLVIFRIEGRRIWYRREGQDGIFAISPRAWRLLPVPVAVENNSQPE